MNEVSQQQTANRQRRSRRIAELAADMLSRYSTLLVLVLLLVVFGATSDKFLLTENLLNILKQTSFVAVLAIGMTMVMLIGGIDLSVGSVVLLTSVVTTILISENITSAWPAILVGLLAAMAVGFVNGVVVEKAKISPVVVTLGTMIAVRGLAQVILWTTGMWLWVEDPVFIYLGEGTLLFLPATVAIMFILYAVAYVVMGQTSLGRYIYAIGGNEQAAELCGIPVQRTKILVYALCGLFAGVGGLLITARMGIINPTVGTGMEFAAITAVILGGTSLSGGVGRIEQTILGALILTVVLNYLTIKGISGNYQSAVQGFVILGAAFLDRLSQGRSAS